MTTTDLRKRPQTQNIALDTLGNSGAGTAANLTSGNMTTYNMFYTSSRCNVTFHTGNSNSPAEYYFEWKFKAVRKPQFYLRRGATKTSPTVGAVKIQWTSKHTLVARGDYEHHPDQVAWNQLSREKNALRWSDYTLSVSDADPTVRIDLRWRKDKHKPLSTVYDCIDQGGNIVARLRSGGGFNWKKGGEIEVESSVSEALKEWLLISGMGIWTWEALDYRSLLQGYDKQAQKGQ